MAKLSETTGRGREYAAIAQQVERILGKDEVASSNLASSSKPLKLLEFQGFFLFLPKSHDLILHIKFDAEKPFDEVTKRDIEAMVVAMRKAGLAHNTIATYNWMLKTLPM